MSFRKIKFFPTTVIFFLFVMNTPAFSSQKIKSPNVSGQFYDANPEKLSKGIESFIQDSKVDSYDKFIDVLISPHAGYMYSGAVAGSGFKAINRNVYKTVIIIAASHYHGFDGVSVGQYDSFKTPLGKFNAGLTHLGFKELIMSHFSTYVNNVPEGIGFDPTQTKKYEITLNVNRVKRIMADITMGKVPKKKGVIDILHPDSID